MQFSAAFFLLPLLSYVVATPVPVANPAAIEVRATTGETNFQAVTAVKTGLKVGENHAFLLKLKVKDQGFPEMNKLTEDIGGSHVFLVVGKASSATSFEGGVYDLVFDKALSSKDKKTANNAAVSMGVADFKMKVPSSATLSYLGAVDGRKVGSIVKKGDAIVAAQGSKYNLESFNCDTFARALYATVKK